MIELIGWDRSSLYQNFRDVPSATILPCPSRRATPFPSGRPRVGTPITTSGLEQLLAVGLARAPRHSILTLEAPLPGPAISKDLQILREQERY